jgi:hypothetical protein
MPEQKYKTVTKLSKDGRRFIKVKVPVKTKETTKKNSTDNRRTITETKLSKDGRRLVKVTRNNKSYNPDFKPGSTVYNSAGEAIKISDGKTFTGGDNVSSRPNIKKTTPKTSEVSQPKRKKQSVASSVTDAKIKKLDTSIKGENIKAKKERSLSESDKQKLAKLQKMKDRADKKQSRKDESIERLAFRMGDKATFQDAAALKQKRGEARKQYLRNFASQLARGEQAAPTKEFGEGDGNPANDATLAGTSAEIAAKNAETNSFATNILSNFSSIGNNNSDLLSNNIQSLGNFESEDSSPTKYIQKEYRKKRGY